MHERVKTLANWHLKVGTGDSSSQCSKLESFTRRTETLLYVVSYWNGGDETTQPIGPECLEVWESDWCDTRELFSDTYELWEWSMWYERGYDIFMTWHQIREGLPKFFLDQLSWNCAPAYPHMSIFWECKNLSCGIAQSLLVSPDVTQSRQKWPFCPRTFP